MTSFSKKILPDCNGFFLQVQIDPVEAIFARLDHEIEARAELLALSLANSSNNNSNPDPNPWTEAIGTEASSSNTCNLVEFSC